MILSCRDGGIFYNYMKRLKTYSLILLLGLLTLNRAGNFGGARLNTSLVNNYNITTVNISSSGTQVGQPLNHDLYSKITTTIKGIEELKKRLSLLVIR